MSRKTYKRELAIASLAVLYVFIGYTLITLAIANSLQSMVDLVSVLIIPTFATVAAAFGIDSYFKQNPKTGNRSDNSEQG